MIDAEGYRPNVGIIICNSIGKLFWAKRVGQNAWQFPQGGIHKGESPKEAMYRELLEETGLNHTDVELIDSTCDWVRYKLPQRYIRQRTSGKNCIGQKQIWHLVRLINDDESRFNFNTESKPEFDNWRWTDYWQPLTEVVDFKRDVYRQVLEYFQQHLKK